MGFLKLITSPTFDSLLKKYPSAFLLLTLIARRAKRIDDTITGLKKCQAFIGDYKSCGLTHQKYRTALKTLELNNLITIQATNKGTIATLLNTEVYDINVEEDNKQNYTEQQTNNKQITTNKNKEVKNKNNSISSDTLLRTIFELPYADENKIGFPITNILIESLQSLYPNLDIKKEFIEIKAELKSNHRGINDEEHMMRFYSRWLIKKHKVCYSQQKDKRF